MTGVSSAVLDRMDEDLVARHVGIGQVDKRTERVLNAVRAGLTDEAWQTVMAYADWKADASSPRDAALWLWEGLGSVANAEDIRGSLSVLREALEPVAKPEPKRDGMPSHYNATVPAGGVCVHGKRPA